MSKLADRVAAAWAAAEGAEEGEKPGQPEWLAIQTDQDGLVAVTPGIFAGTAAEAEAVAKDMARRSGTRGRITVVRRDEAESHGLFYKL